jgi:hypothetical protein
VHSAAITTALGTTLVIPGDIAAINRTNIAANASGAEDPERRPDRMRP